MKNFRLVKYIPNALSVLRILLSVYLLFIARQPLLFTVIYLIIGATDVFDGKIARRFHVTSELGSKLDAVGDSMLFGAGLVCMLFLADLRKDSWLKCLISLLPAIAYKLANVAVTHARFGEWNMMHTHLNRSVFVGVYFLVPVFLLMGELNFGIVLGFSIAICLACFEETVTLARMETYDVNHRGIVGEKIEAKLFPKKERSA